MEVEEGEQELLVEVARTATDLLRNYQQMAIIRAQLPGLAWHLGRERTMETMGELAELIPRFHNMEESMMDLLGGKVAGPALSDRGRSAVANFVELLRESQREIEVLIRELENATTQEVQ